MMTQVHCVRRDQCGVIHYPGIGSYSCGETEASVFLRKCIQHSLLMRSCDAVHHAVLLRGLEDGKLVQWDYWYGSIQ